MQLPSRKVPHNMFIYKYVFVKDSVVKCKARVHESREAARTRGLDHGVNPSVGLGKLSLSLYCVRSKFIMFEVLKIIYVG